jgi:hypothetical protein
MPVPLRAIRAVGLLEEVLVIVSAPDAAPTTVGLNCTFSVAVCPGVKVAGNEGPDSVKPVPVTTADLTVTGVVPVDDKLTICIAGVFNATSPNPTLVALMPSVDVPKLIVNVTVCV